MGRADGGGGGEPEAAAGVMPRFHRVLGDIIPAWSPALNPVGVLAAEPEGEGDGGGAPVLPPPGGVLGLYVGMDGGAQSNQEDHEAGLHKVFTWHFHGGPPG